MAAKTPTNGKQNYTFYRPKKHWVLASTSVALLSLFLTRSSIVKAESNNLFTETTKSEAIDNSSEQSTDVGRLIVNFIDVDPDRSDVVQNKINSFKIDRNEEPGSNKILKIDIPDEYLLTSTSRTLLYTIKPHEITTISVNVKHRREFGSPQLSTVINFNPANISDDFLKDNNIQATSKTIYWGTVHDLATGTTKYIPYDDPSGSIRLFKLPSWEIPFDTRFDYSVSNSNLDIVGTYAIITPNLPSFDNIGAVNSLPDNSFDVSLSISKSNNVDPDEKPDPTPEVDPDEKPDPKPEVDPDEKPDPTPEVNPEENTDKPNTTPDNNDLDNNDNVKPDINTEDTTKPDIDSESKPDSKPDKETENKPVEETDKEPSDKPNKPLDPKVNQNKNNPINRPNQVLNSNDTNLVAIKESRHSEPNKPVAGALLGSFLNRSKNEKTKSVNGTVSDSTENHNKQNTHTKTESKGLKKTSEHDENSNTNSTKKYPHVDRDIAATGSQHSVAAGLGNDNGFSQLGLYFSALSGVVNFGTRV